MIYDGNFELWSDDFFIFFYFSKFLLLLVTAYYQVFLTFFSLPCMYHLWCYYVVLSKYAFAGLSVYILLEKYIRIICLWLDHLKSNYAHMRAYISINKLDRIRGHAFSYTPLFPCCMTVDESLKHILSCSSEGPAKHRLQATSILKADLESIKKFTGYYTWNATMDQLSN